MPVPSYPKIFAIGSKPIGQLFDGEVEVTEKIDGSLFAFGRDEDGQFVMRSKGQQLFPEQHEGMFAKAVAYALTVADGVAPGTYYYGEFLRDKRHNTLTYDRAPKNHIILFGACGPEGWVTEHGALNVLADQFGLEAVALLARGVVSSCDGLAQFLECRSALGGESVEGLVVKNYAQTTLVGNHLWPQFGKLVADRFKERHEGESYRFSKKAPVEAFIEGFRTEARWLKAVQHLRERGELIQEPKDIGALLREINTDIDAEETEAIRDGLYRLFIKDIKGKAGAGFPEWYKTQLAEGAFAEQEE